MLSFLSNYEFFFWFHSNFIFIQWSIFKKKEENPLTNEQISQIHFSLKNIISCKVATK